MNELNGEWKKVLIFISVLYAIGFVIVNMYLGTLGIYCVEIFKNSYIMAGVWFIVYLSEIFCVIGSLTKRKNIKRKLRNTYGVRKGKYTYKGKIRLCEAMYYSKWFKNFKKLNAKIKIKELGKNVFKYLKYSIGYSLVISFIVSTTGKFGSNSERFEFIHNPSNIVLFIAMVVIIIMSRDFMSAMEEKNKQKIKERVAEEPITKLDEKLLKEAKAPSKINSITKYMIFGICSVTILYFLILAGWELLIPMDITNNLKLVELFVVSFIFLNIFNLILIFINVITKLKVKVDFWVYVLLIIMFVGGFVKNIYPNIPKEFGGGMPYQVNVVSNNDEYEILMKDAKIYFIDKTNNEYYFVRISGDRKSVITMSVSEVMMIDVIK